MIKEIANRQKMLKFGPDPGFVVHFIQKYEKIISYQPSTSIMTTFQIPEQKSSPNAFETLDRIITR